jgi:hypothetical protein
MWCPDPPYLGYVKSINNRATHIFRENFPDSPLILDTKEAILQLKDRPCQLLNAECYFMSTILP